MMKLASVMRCVVLLVLIVAAAQSVAQQQKGDVESVQSSSSQENFGLYEWSPWQDAWVLVYATFEDFAEWEPMTAYDHYLPPSVFGAGGGGEHEMPQSQPGERMSQSQPGGRSGFDDHLQSQGPLPLPPMIVTAPRPQPGGVMYLTVFRPILLAGDGSGFARSGVVINTNDQDMEGITCATEQDVRSSRAGAAYIRSGRLPRRGVVFTVRFPSGATQTFIGVSSAGTPWVQPISDCQGGG
jgi:hypothetical protein